MITRTECGPSPQTLPDRSATLPASRILLVEDEPGVRGYLELILQTLGCRIRSEENGVKGLEVFAREGADLVITDLSMPEMDGFELIDRLRHHAPKLPVIGISGLVPRARKLSWSQEPSVVAVFRKPLDEEAFVQTVRSVLERAGHPGESRE